MNERLKELRQSLHLTLEKFGQRIGVKKAAVSRWENGDNIADRMILSICREFNVNEEWLRTGKGDMHKLIEDEVSAAASDITDSEDYIMQDLIVVYRSLSPASKDALAELAKGVFARMKAREEREE